MTSLNEILARNIKEYRGKIGLSQAKLAKKAGISLSYLAAVEVCSKFPSPKNLEKLAKALEIETPELFSMPSSARDTAVKLQRAILADLSRKLSVNIDSTVKATVAEIVADHLKEMEKQERLKKKK